MRLPDGARVAIVGGGPAGIVAAKEWDAAAEHSGVWPGMHTNTSRMMTAFSDLPAPPNTRCTLSEELGVAPDPAGRRRRSVSPPARLLAARAGRSG